MHAQQYVIFVIKLYISNWFVVLLQTMTMENMNIVNYCGQVEGYTIIIRAKEIRVIERWSRQQKQA